MAISKEDLSIISKNFDKQVQKAIEKIIDANKKAEETQKNYFKETERLLYSYSALKLKVAQDEEDFKNGVFAANVNKSKSIVRFSSGMGSRPPEEAVQEEFERSKRASIERTRLRVKEIERGLDRVRNNKYYRIIELKYGIPPQDFDWKNEKASVNLAFYDPIPIEEIAEECNCDASTVKRNRSKLVNMIKLSIFGDVT